MIMVLIVPNCYLVAIKMSSGGQDVVNVIGVQASSSTAQAVAQTVKDGWVLSGGPMNKHATTTTGVGVTAMDISSANGAIAVVPFTNAGTEAGALATNGSCALVSYGGGTRSRSSRGRLYHGPLREGQIESNGRHLTATALVNINNGYVVFKNHLNAAGMFWTVISRKLQTANNIGAPSTQLLIATQRRRIR